MCNSAAELVAHVGCVRLHRPKIFSLSKKNWLHLSSDTHQITPGSANPPFTLSKRVSNSWLPLPASVEKEPNGIRIQKLPGTSSEWDPYPDADGFWHCDNQRSMYLAICFLTVLTAAGDEQFEESPEQCETRENSYLNRVLDQMVKWKTNTCERTTRRNTRISSSVHCCVI